MKRIIQVKEKKKTELKQKNKTEQTELKDKKKTKSVSPKKKSVVASEDITKTEEVIKPVPLSKQV